MMIVMAMRVMVIVVTVGVAHVMQGCACKVLPLLLFVGVVPSASSV